MAKKGAGSKSPQDALFAAVVSKDANKVRQALAAGADPNGRTKDYSFTALMIAVGPAGSDDVAVALVEAGADPREADEQGFTALHYASHLRKVRACEALLRAGADPNAVSTARSPSFEGMTKGATPLKVAGGAAIKELLAGVTTVGLATNAFAKKLDHLRGFYSSAIDFEGGEPEVDGLAGCETEGYLFPIGQTGSGSVFALWSSKKTEEPKDGPIVYLDSEGDPRCAVARSLDDFLSVLPFGTGWIHDAARGTPSPAKQSLAAAATAQEAAEDQDGKPVLAGKPYADWWKGQFGVAPAKDPEGLVAAARSAKPTLEAWIRKKAG